MRYLDSIGYINCDDVPVLQEGLLNVHKVLPVNHMLRVTFCHFTQVGLGRSHD